MRLGFSDDGDLQELLYHTYCRDWHDNERTLLKDFVSQGQTVIDVGANMGFMAVILSRLVGEKGRVICFEPSRRIFKKLRETIELNNIQNAELFNYGCGERRTEGELFKVSESSGNSSLVRPSGSKDSDSGERVELLGLDEALLSSGTRVDFMKIDVEGYESTVLRGAAQILSRFKPVIYIELCAEYSQSSSEAIEILKSNGYVFTPEPDTGAANGVNFIARHRSSITACGPTS
jgi:FkbM family methyltransferase